MKGTKNMIINELKLPASKPRPQPQLPKESYIMLKDHKTRKKANKKTLIVAIIALLALASAGFFAYKYYKIQSDPRSQIEQRNNTETKEVIEALGRIILLPTDRQPTVAKVEDVDALKKTNQTFYRDVFKGDYLVLYTDRAIIFRKQENKVINVAPIVDSSKISQPTEAKISKEADTTTR